MSLVIMLPNELEVRVKEAAAQRGLHIEEYVITAVERALTKQSQDEAIGLANGAAAKSTLSPNAELDAILDELAAGTEHLPPLPPNFSRADIYFDHD